MNMELPGRMKQSEGGPSSWVVCTGQRMNLQAMNDKTTTSWEQHNDRLCMSREDTGQGVIGGLNGQHLVSHEVLITEI